MGGQKKKPLWGTCIGIYAGQYYDSETGLHYNYHRYYDPKLGRYLRADPLGANGRRNLYVYAQNNPISFMDPYGLEEQRFFFVKYVCNVTCKINCPCDLKLTMSENVSVDLPYSNSTPLIQTSQLSKHKWGMIANAIERIKPKIPKDCNLSHCFISPGQCWFQQGAY